MPQVLSTLSTVTGSATGPLPTISEVDLAVQDVATAKLLGDRTLPYDQIQNNCERRAHVASAYLLGTHPKWLIGKVFVFGRLQPLPTLRKFGWGYHVAPIVAARGDDGKATLRVIDPAFNGTRALPLGDWLAKSEAGSKAYIANVYIESADVLYHGEAPATASFCDEVKSASIQLKDYSTHAGVGPRSREHLSIARVDREHNLVWFEHEGVRTDYFVFREDLGATLESASKSKRKVKITYARDVIEKSGFLGLFKSNFLLISEVAVEP